MLLKLRLFFSPPHPVPRMSLYASSVFISSLGRGLWLPFALLYFLLVAGLSLPLIGLALTIGGPRSMARTALAGTAGGCLRSLRALAGVQRTGRAYLAAFAASPQVPP